MRRWLTLSTLLLPLGALAEGAIMIQPKLNGEIHIFSEGATGGGGQDVMAFTQKAGKSLTVNVIPSGPASCKDGNIVLPSSLRLPMTLVESNHKLRCGEPLFFDSDASQRLLRVKVEANYQQQNSRALFAQQEYSGRVQIGSVSFNTEAGESEQFPIYLDATLLAASTAPVLKVAFNKSAASFGQVSEMQDYSITRELRITKKTQASEESFPYTVKFESSQIQNGHYNLRPSTGDNLVPYQILVEGKEVLPEGDYQGQLPSGKKTSQTLNIEFKLAGHNFRGMAAKTRLLDTITAVITPES
ncbi:hypothetical protein ACFSFZ_01225 [Mixta tenebrionis]|uniref:Fimbrial protein n=1 Tax=Mixta tenebrionis TaxID=2562439 RepID=A0A506V8Q6_9GAMM|nr:hypothetical protein [Mixta tenebrionis]TPW42067.1 hypothetical protein FKM52_11985 [Mixta tenebrionis]